MSFLNPRQWLLVIAFLGAGFLGVKFWEHRLVQQGYDKAQAEYAVKLAKAQTKAAEQAADLQNITDNLRRIKNAEVAALTRSRDAALAELRKRPERPAGYVPAPASDGSITPGCTGAQLFRPDAEFLVREAAAADELRLALSACYKQYSAAQSALSEGKP